jgi:hypothetical protein
MRRNLNQLLLALINARDAKGNARACYQLGLFHDNNSREAEAIPYYRKAIRYGLGRNLEGQARSWLASSLYKIGNYRGAARECRTAIKMTREPKLLKFLMGLQVRILARNDAQK